MRQLGGLRLLPVNKRALARPSTAISPRNELKAKSKGKKEGRKEGRRKSLALLSERASGRARASPLDRWRRRRSRRRRPRPAATEDDGRHQKAPAKSIASCRLTLKEIQGSATRFSHTHFSRNRCLSAREKRCDVTGLISGQIRSTTFELEQRNVL